MNHFKEIEKKLKKFYKKYYKNQLIKGVLLFLSFGLSYFLLTTFVEFTLWLKPLARTILFWSFVLVELYFFFRFIGRPVFKLVQTSKGITNKQLSTIVGKHFKEVEDRLLNVLQLKESNDQSALLLASIEQKSKELAPIPFNKAINYRWNFKYLKFVIIPLLLVLVLFFTNLINDFSTSFNRLINYQTTFKPPAPFEFFIESNALQAIQGEDFLLKLVAKGNIVPSEAKIIFDNQEYYLNNKGFGQFEFRFSQLQKSVVFYVEAGSVKSNEFTIDVLNTPRIKSISLDIIYPSYTKEQNKTIDSPSNLIVPEGTKITWNVTAQNTQNIEFILNKIKESFIKESSDMFRYKKNVKTSFRYQISSSNKQIINYENLSFSINTVKDESPKISVQSNIDSLQNDPIYFIGQISDDYGISKLHLVYNEEGDLSTTKTKRISVTKENLQNFYYDFPGELKLKEGVAYEMFFEVFDNDAVNGSKKTQSKRFSYRLKTKDELEQELLEDQKDAITKLEKSLLNQKQQKTDLEQVKNDLQNKQNMNWNDKKKLENLIKRQKQYKQMMEKQSDKLLQNLDNKKEDNETIQNNKEELKKRLEELRKQQKQQKLLEELEELTKRLDKEELAKKTKELAEQNKQQERSLERILELTKRFYVEQKMTQIANKLQKQFEQQNKLASKEDKKPEEQKEASKEFDKVQKELEQLEKDNKNLKSPMDLPDVLDEQFDIKKEQNEAEENIENKNNAKAKKNQKKAADKLKQMSQKMQKAMFDMQANSIQENAEDLRKILKNLITFSFQQEDLMSKFEEIDFQHPDFGKSIRKQNNIKTYFEHIDDSLYVLSMRVPQITTKIQNDLANVHYNLNESLENFTERRFNSGISNQQFVMTSANNLADFLSNLLNNMNNNMSSTGKGKPKESSSLPDIIKQQEGLSKKASDQKGKQQQKDGKDGEKGKNERQQQEDFNGELYQIYQQQSQLKEQLQNLLEDGNGSKGLANKVIKSMESLEKDILEKGLTNEVIQKMQNIEYKLLKLEKASIEQNKDKKRKSNTNTNTFSKENLKSLEINKLFYNQLEILNRQSLPLQQNYIKKVQEYFSKNKKD